MNVMLKHVGKVLPRGLMHVGWEQRGAQQRADRLHPLILVRHHHERARQLRLYLERRTFVLNKPNNNDGNDAVRSQVQIKITVLRWGRRFLQ